ncbi:hypothetical protein GZH46_01086 [Fragariocoptes setiger]|uniref:BHLH domain-containing protein n=1 Tax=Fragariocoptes setiger TaxID=1670756 RepID=A0ABQ7SAF9_9ACAR|nr:hypothetical protein GZH46_01086 [Fragariocoptes setiger]
MEKRRRARINTCLDILKSYVLTNTPLDLSRHKQQNETNGYGHHVVTSTSSNNAEIDTILKPSMNTNSGNSKKSRQRNPNKLEKADILEMTVEYVRRLHLERLKENARQCDTLWRPWDRAN